MVVGKLTRFNQVLLVNQMKNKKYNLLLNWANYLVIAFFVAFALYVTGHLIYFLCSLI